MGLTNFKHRENGASINGSGQYDLEDPVDEIKKLNGKFEGKKSAILRAAKFGLFDQDRFASILSSIYLSDVPSPMKRAKRTELVGLMNSVVNTLKEKKGWVEQDGSSDIPPEIAEFKNKLECIVAFRNLADVIQEIQQAGGEVMLIDLRLLVENFNKLDEKNIDSSRLIDIIREQYYADTKGSNNANEHKITVNYLTLLETIDNSDRAVTITQFQEVLVEKRNILFKIVLASSGVSTWGKRVNKIANEAKQLH